MKEWCESLFSDQRLLIGVTYRGEQHDGSCYSGFNLCHYTGDEAAHTSLCRQELAQRLGIDKDSIIVPRQTHSSNVMWIDSLHVAAHNLEGVDALVTSMPNVAIGISTADCVPCVFADEEAGLIGVAHAGWRGAVDGIVGKTLALMQKRGADFRRMRAWIGPSICVDCFEVGEEVAQRFPQEFVARRQDWPKPHVDLPGFVRSQIIGSGIAEENIVGFDTAMCTRCHPDKYFSARALGLSSGRNFTFALLH